ncbi:MAG: AraC family transcriptional regulator, partial [Bacteroidota bacterium]
MADILFFNYNDMSSVLLIFFVHALVFSFLLLKKGIADNQHESMWLAAFILLGGLYICPFMLGYAGWYSTNPYREFMFFFPFQQLFLIGPVFYFYILTLLNRDFKFVRWDWLHFFPALLYMLYSLIVFITDKLILDELYFYADNKDKDLDVWYQVAGLISMLFYLILSLRHYLSYRKLSLEEVSYADEISFKWIQYFTLALGIILILRILFFILNPEWGEFGRKFWYYLCFSILL